MKKIILGSMFFAFSAHAQVQVIPYVSNFYTSAQVQISNQNIFNVNCSGFVYMHLASGIVDSQYYYDTVMSRGFSYRSFFPPVFNDRITFTNHSIYCRQN